MLLHGLAAVDKKDAVYQRPKRGEIGAAHSFHHQLVALKGPNRI
jgi:hypothetical protein